MNFAVAHFYKKYRGNLERTAEDALMSAKRHVAFRERLAEMVSTGNRRSTAAKRGWKKRRAS